MNKVILMAAAAGLTLVGCTVLPKPPVALDDPAKRTGPAHEQPESTEYVADLAQQLMNNASVDTRQALVGVTTLSGVTTDYNQSTPFAQMLSQQLMTELHKQRLSVMDFKTTDFIRVTEDGDFALTRDYMELDEILPMTHVLVGTLTQHRDGVLISARLVDINSKNVVSVAQTFVPEHVVRHLSESSGHAIIRKAP